MNFSEIKPFIRFARYETIYKNTISSRTAYGVDCRLLFPLSQTANMVIDGNNIELSPGDLVIINSSVPYRCIIDSSPVNYIILNFDFTFRYSDVSTPVVPVSNIESLENSLIEHVQFEDCVAFNKYVVIKNAFFIENNLEKIIFEYNMKKPYYNFYISTMLSEILLLCARHVYSTQLIMTANHKILDNVLNYMCKNYTEQITNTSLGKMFGFHANYLENLIKDYTGISIHQYLLKLRMEKALTLLQTTNFKIDHIANLVGISNPAYFSRYFKKFYGYPPSKANK